jgi:hypothetical protein
LLNTTVEINSPRSTLTGRFFEHFPDSTAPAKYTVKITLKQGYHAFVNRRKVADAKVQTDVLVAVEAWMRENYAYRLGNFVHAACAAVDGHAILLPRESHTGKSTIVASIVRLGARYCSDELAEVRTAGVGTYPKPLYLRPPGVKNDTRKVVYLQEKEVAPDSTYPVSVITFPKIGAKDRLVNIPRPEALARLASRFLCKTLSYRQLELLKRIVLGSRTYTLEWCDPGAAASLAIEAGSG